MSEFERCKGKWCCAENNSNNAYNLNSNGNFNTNNKNNNSNGVIGVFECIL